MRVPARLDARRSSLIAACLALVALVGGQGSTLAVGGSAAATPVAVEVPVPRQQRPGETPGFRLPFAEGLQVKVSQGWRSSYTHNGKSTFAYDFRLREGTPVLASAGGVVAFVRDGNRRCGGKKLRPYANYVTINHPDGSATHYGHLAKVKVRVGDVVAAGDVIGRSGKTGFTSCQPHLHFARQVQGGGVTKSIPIYFEGYADRRLHAGNVVEASDDVPCRQVDPEAKRYDPDTPTDGFCGSFSALGSEEEPGLPYFSRVDEAIDFDWAAEAPGGYWLDDPSGGFAARWSGQFLFTNGGTYAFGAVATDRIRVLVDGAIVLDGWEGSPAARALATTWDLGPGVHRVELVYEDLDGEGILRLDWVELTLGSDGRWTTSGPLPS